MITSSKAPARPKKQPVARVRPTDAATGPQTFDWPLAHEAEDFLRQRTGEFLESNSFACDLAKRMRDETGTDFFEWIDHLVLAMDNEEGLRKVGFVRDERAETPKGEPVYEHPRATLPRVLLRPGQQKIPSVIALRPEFVTEFTASNHLFSKPDFELEGDAFSRYRRIIVSRENGTTLEAVERHGYRGFVPAPLK